MISRIQYRRKGADGVITLKDSVGIANAFQLKEVLIQAFSDEKATTVRINVDADGRLDTAIIQLMICFKRDLNQKGRTFQIVSPPQSTILNSARLGGLL